MSDVIKFLERIATSATLSEDENWLKELASMQLDPELELALKNKDQEMLEKLLGSRTNLVAGIFPAEDDEPEQEDEPEEEEKEDKKEESRRACSY